MVPQFEVKEIDEKAALMQNHILDLPKQTLGRLSIFQKHARAILVQNLELHEYPTPRLFVILPVDKAYWDPADVLENRFRLHFLCECGYHAMETSKDSKNHVHAAKHQGYEIRNSTEFFSKYGKYMLILMRALRMGMHSVDISKPHTTSPSLLDAGIDHSITYMETLAASDPALNDIDTIDDFEGLEAVDLSQLETFLRINGQEIKFGDLYRVTIEAGHVKWVCFDHYRSIFTEKDQKALEDVIQLNGGYYDAQLGRVVIVLKSRIRAEEFFDALAKARHVYDLDISFNWACSMNDLGAFEKALKASNVSVLRLYLRQFQTSTSLTSKLLPASLQFDKLVNIIEHTNMRSIRIFLSMDSIRLSNIQPKTSHLRTFSIKVISRSMGVSDIPALENSLKAKTSLNILDLGNSSITDAGAYALSEALRSNTTLANLDLENNSIGEEGALALSEALKSNTTLATLDLGRNSVGDEGVLALSEILKTNTALTELDLRNNSIGKEGAIALSEALKTNTTLTTLNLCNNSIGDEGAIAISKTLKANTTLTTLSMGGNSIGEEGAIALSEALEHSTTLTNLNLQFNCIWNEGVLALSEALKHNAFLAITL
ncbi:hypothetical protein BGZ46_004381 [Entomortierella lignicola]|nr:hypothetical protein BGZ46_004381 [Entomortierella lignicola]